MTKDELIAVEAIRYLREMRRCKCFLKEWPSIMRERKTREESWGISPNGINGKRNCRWRKLVRTTMWWNRRKWEKWKRSVKK